MLVVHGLDLSYFTGKLEGYLRARGLPYRLEEMDTRAFKSLTRHTGVRQMPQLELPDGRWMTDTVQIIDALEHELPQPGITPSDSACAFLAGLIETYADEHLWRPALYYRWAFDDDARLMSARLARGMLRDVAGPFALKRQFILLRQRVHYLRGEGVTSANRHQIEADYLDLLDALEPVLRRRDWVLGEAPTRADIGLFGPMFRHFHCDPTPGRIMRARAPAVAAWVARLWALEGPVGSGAQSMTSVPRDLEDLFRLIADRFLPELVANAAAVAAGQGATVHRAGDTVIRYRSNPYRAGRLSRLNRDFEALDPPAKGRVAAVLGEDGTFALSGSTFTGFRSADPLRIRDRWGCDIP
jgi:glutathione S-transferase